MNTRQDIEITNPQEEVLIKKIRALPPEKIAEVEDFVDFLRGRNEDRLLTQAAAKLSENAFRKAWDNPDDADYDRL
ncbi:MAG: toxin-antitoxin system, antitoxin component, Xre family protein [Thermodesulfobacteriota bacterium]